MTPLEQCTRYVALEDEQHEIDRWFLATYGKTCEEFMAEMRELLAPAEPIASRRGCPCR